jgi:hypothetical protein
MPTGRSATGGQAGPEAAGTGEEALAGTDQERKPPVTHQVIAPVTYQLRRSLHDRRQGT